MRVIIQNTEAIDIDNLLATHYVFYCDGVGFFQLRQTSNGWGWYGVLDNYHAERAQTSMSFGQVVRHAITTDNRALHAFDTQSEAIIWMAQFYGE